MDYVGVKNDFSKLTKMWYTCHVTTQYLKSNSTFVTTRWCHEIRLGTWKRVQVINYCILAPVQPKFSYDWTVALWEIFALPITLIWSERLFNYRQANNIYHYKYVQYHVTYGTQQEGEVVWTHVVKYVIISDSSGWHVQVIFLLKSKSFKSIKETVLN